MDFEKLKKKFEILDTGIEIRQGSRWDKILEHHVANRCPSAYSRMYNYLIIYGALRLISLIMLMILWIFIFNDLIIKIECLKLGYFFQCLSLKISLQYLIICSVYIMALMAFSKFNRRYFEESVLGFLFSDGDVAPVHQSPRASIV